MLNGEVPSADQGSRHGFRKSYIQDQFPTQFDVRNFNFTNRIILIKNLKQSRTET